MILDIILYWPRLFQGRHRGCAHGACIRHHIPAGRCRKMRTLCTRDASPMLIGPISSVSTNRLALRWKAGKSVLLRHISQSPCHTIWRVASLHLGNIKLYKNKQCHRTNNIQGFSCFYPLILRLAQNIFIGQWIGEFNLCIFNISLRYFILF